jgi:mono/diheme cytochrome c family protein
MTRSLKKTAALALLIVSGALLSAHADSNKNNAPMVKPLPKYQQECSACHMAYPVGMLPSASWANLMGNLSKHYGTDASLDAASVREISGWLNLHAGTYKRVSEMPPQDRITKSAWFLRKHRDGEVPVGVWARASVGSAANCVACHSGAAQGNFNERDIRIPR